MKKFFYYRNFDQVKEPIDFGNFVNQEEALLYFSKRKNLTINEFINLFTISRWNFKINTQTK
jgi:hypothetical protein